MEQRWTVLAVALAAHLVLAASPSPLLAQAAPATAAPAPRVEPVGATNPAGPANAAPGTAGPGASANPREQQLLERIRQLKTPRWRSYGVCRYDWTSWRLMEGAVRTTEVECGPDNSRAVVAVHCPTLQVSRREGAAAWSPWRLPLATAESKTTGGEDLMVAALCANIQATPEGATAPVPLAPAPSNPARPAAGPARAPNNR
ncbi:MAG: hypothetical protein ACKO7Z_06755 [Cyanobacteriota bacterium]